MRDNCAWWRKLCSLARWQACTLILTPGPPPKIPVPSQFHRPSFIGLRFIGQECYPPRVSGLQIYAIPVTTGTHDSLRDCPILAQVRLC